MKVIERLRSRRESARQARAIALMALEQRSRRVRDELLEMANRF